MLVDKSQMKGPSSSGVLGAIAELIAAAHLMREGWYVYRCESPHAPFDLAIYRDGRMLRVEVKTLTRTAGDVSCPSFPAPTNDEWDLIAVVDRSTGKTYLFESVAEGRAAIRREFGWDGERVTLPCGHTSVRAEAHTCSWAPPEPIWYSGDTKTCSACGRDLPVEHFGIASDTRDRLNRACRACTRDRSRNYRQRSKEST